MTASHAGNGQCDCEEVRRKNDTLRANLKKMKEKIMDVHTLIDLYQATDEDLRITKETLASVTEMAEKRLLELKEVKGQVKALQSTIKQTSAGARTKEMHRDTAAGQHDTARLQQDMARLRQDAARLRQENIALKAEKDAMSKRDTLHQERSDCPQPPSSLAEVRQEMARVQEALAEETSNVLALRQEISHLKEDNRRKESHLGLRRQEISRLKEDRIRTGSNLAELRQEMAKVKEDNDQKATSLAQEINRLKEENSLKESAQKSSRLKEDKRVAELAQEISRLKEDNCQKASSLSELHQEICILKEENSQKASDLAKLRQETTRLKSNPPPPQRQDETRVQALQAKCRDLEATLASARAARESQRRHATRQVAALTALQQKTAKLHRLVVHQQLQLFERDGGDGLADVVPAGEVGVSDGVGDVPTPTLSSVWLSEGEVEGDELFEEVVEEEVLVEAMALPTPTSTPTPKVTPTATPPANLTTATSKRTTTPTSTSTPTSTPKHTAKRTSIASPTLRATPTPTPKTPTPRKRRRVFDETPSPRTTGATSDASSEDSASDVDDDLPGAISRHASQKRPRCDAQATFCATGSDTPSDPACDAPTCRAEAWTDADFERLAGVVRAATCTDADPVASSTTDPDTSSATAVRRALAHADLPRLSTLRDTAEATRYVDVLAGLPDGPLSVLVAWHLAAAPTPPPPMAVATPVLRALEARLFARPQVYTPASLPAVRRLTRCLLRGYARCATPRAWVLDTLQRLLYDGVWRGRKDTMPVFSLFIQCFPELLASPTASTSSPRPAYSPTSASSSSHASYGAEEGVLRKTYHYVLQTLYAQGLTSDWRAAYEQPFSVLVASLGYRRPPAPTTMDTLIIHVRKTLTAYAQHLTTPQASWASHRRWLAAMDVSVLALRGAGASMASVYARALATPLATLQRQCPRPATLLLPDAPPPGPASPRASPDAPASPHRRRRGAIVGKHEATASCAWVHAQACRHLTHAALGHALRVGGVAPTDAPLLDDVLRDLEAPLACRVDAAPGWGAARVAAARAALGRVQAVAVLALLLLARPVPPGAPRDTVPARVARRLARWYGDGAVRHAKRQHVASMAAQMDASLPGLTHLLRTFHTALDAAP